MNYYYKKIFIWKRINENEAVRYNCFEVLGINKFCVQSADYYYMPFNEDSIRELEENFYDLFFECPPDERSDLYDSIEAAIENF